MKGSPQSASAVPWKELKKVTIIVDPNDDVHEAISFSGRVHRE